MGLLRARPAFRDLWLGRLVSFLGDSLGMVALILYVAERAGTGTAVGLLLLAGDMVPAAAGPFVGALADRVRRRRLMVACEVLQGAVMLLIALAEPPLVLLLALVGLRATLAAAFQPAARSAVPDLVGDDELERANALLGFGTWGLDAVGPLIAAALLPFLDVRGLLVVDAVSFFLAVPFLLRLPALGPAPREEETRLRTDVLEGLRFVWSERLVRVVVLGFAAVVLCTAIDDVALVFFATDTLRAGETVASLLYAGSGIGLLLGFLFLTRRASGGRARALLLVGLAVASGGNALTGLSRVAAVALSMQVLRGLGIALVEVGHNVVLQREVPAHLRGRAFANLYTALGLAAGLAYLLGGPLVDATSPATALVVSGTLGVAAAGVMALRLRGTPATSR
ncbi:MAG TPA: MFS transporter [Frankiaceae bacterium]|nr:MFS transporter [Frankiaceae bacterium]